MERDGRLKLRITVDGDADGRAALSLLRWLDRDPVVLREATLTSERSTAGTGEMNAVFDAVIAVVSDSTALGSLLVACMAWRDARPRKPSAVIEHKGVVVHLSDATPEQVYEIVEKLAGDKE